MEAEQISNVKEGGYPCDETGYPENGPFHH
jgi:hypothetical protein